jgi:hypothetical protein
LSTKAISVRLLLLQLLHQNGVIAPMKTPALSDSTSRLSAAFSTLRAMLDAPEQGDSPQAFTSDSG